MINKLVTLKDGNQIPSLGFGTWQLEGDECLEATIKALQTGYRLIDTADAYHNHKEVGQAIRNSGIKREDIYLSSKLWPSDLSYYNVIAAVDRFLKELDTNYLNLLLIHWPNKNIPIAETLEAMDEIKGRGLVKSIGVSNFNIRLLQEAIETDFPVVINQVEFHPSLNQKELKKYCDQQQIIIMAYSPIAQGQDLYIPIIEELSQKYHRSPSQIILNWLISQNMIPIPKATSQSHIEDNFQSLAFQLSPTDIEFINSINIHHRLINPSFASFDE
jgi:diketogulonate reductase-like aldo/keto reductase